MILRSLNKLLVTTLMIAGISLDENNYTNIKEAVNEPVITTTIEEPTLVSEEISLLEKLANKEVTDINTTDYMLENINNLNTIGYTTEEELYISAYAYQKILNSNIDHDKALEELNNLLIEQSYPRGLDIDEYNMLYGNLSSTLKEKESLGDTYSVLAYLIHCDSCNKDHYINDNYTIECENIKNEYTKKRTSN